jgi:hypothetical protein
MSTNVDERYLSWLCGLIADGGRGKDSQIRNSEAMIRSLFDETFHHFVPNDDNRASEGMGLRDRYLDETGFEIVRHFYLRPCSVLEMLIALSERMAFQIFNPMKERDPDVPGCFWEIAENLDLKPNQSNARITDRLMRRAYNEDGLGGMFPLENNKEDQRAVEIWYQMMAYLMENY